MGTVIKVDFSGKSRQTKENSVSYEAGLMYAKITLNDDFVNLPERDAFLERLFSHVEGAYHLHVGVFLSVCEEFNIALDKQGELFIKLSGKIFRFYEIENGEKVLMGKINKKPIYDKPGPFREFLQRLHFLFSGPPIF